MLENECLEPNFDIDLKGLRRKVALENLMKKTLLKVSDQILCRWIEEGEILQNKFAIWSDLFLFRNKTNKKCMYRVLECFINKKKSWTMLDHIIRIIYKYQMNVVDID